MATDRVMTYLVTRFDLSLEDQVDVRKHVESLLQPLSPPLSPVRPAGTSKGSKKDVKAYLEAHYPGKTVLILTDYREKCHGIFGDVLILSDITLLSSYASRSNDPLLGPAFFISKKRLDAVKKNFVESNILFAEESLDAFNARA